jgi:hypothetical protein
MPTPRRRRQPDRSRRRALELLAGCGADGCPEAILLGHGFTVEMLVELAAGLVTATAERVVAGKRSMEVARVRITDAGRKALADAKR